jgi:hypothetical protein
VNLHRWIAKMGLWGGAVLLLLTVSALTVGLSLLMPWFFTVAKAFGAAAAGLLFLLEVHFVLTTFITAVGWRRDARDNQRAHVGCCSRCNYDRRSRLAASPCPKCGAVAARHSQAKT